MNNYFINTVIEGIKKSDKLNLKKVFIPEYRASYFRWNIKKWLLYFHKRILYPSGEQGKCKWMGIATQKLPLDLWLYQEIIFELRPDYIVEIGSYNGGTTLYFANMMDLVGHGNVVSIEIDRSRYVAKHDRIIEITGDSGSREVLEKVDSICKGKKVMVVHDGDHSKKAVLRDLNMYSRFVSLGSYLVVEDGIVDQFRAGECIGMPEGGPLAAVRDFLKNSDDFVIDKSKEKFIITYHPEGFLKRIK